MTDLPTPLAALMDRAKADRKKIVLSEGADIRVARAAVMAQADGLADLVLIGRAEEVAAGLEQAGGTPGDFDIQDPQDSPRAAEMAAAFHDLRKHKGVTPEKAAMLVQDPLVYSAMLVRLGHADGTIAGAVSPTPDVVRAAIQVIGKAPASPLVSSFFLMVLTDGRPVIFSDSGLVVDPSAEELAAIAAQSADSFSALTGGDPRIAMLSFSTKGSAAHPMVSKVQQATEMAKTANPDLALDGELQFDAAFVPNVGASKAPGSDVAGQANVFIFPNLDAGNIGYKIAQRIGGATAIGPILQGLAKPANDLSRGCSAEDVVAMIAVTSAQAQALD